MGRASCSRFLPHILMGGSHISLDQRRPGSTGLSSAEVGEKAAHDLVEPVGHLHVAHMAGPLENH